MVIKLLTMQSKGLTRSAILSVVAELDHVHGTFKMFLILQLLQDFSNKSVCQFKLSMFVTP